MNNKQLEIMKNKKGFVAALDQSGGSTPKALLEYGVKETAYSNSEEMFKLVHDMRTRIIKTPAFSNQKILAAILFEVTMDSKIDGLYTADYLWEKKEIVPILKIDKGLKEMKNGVKKMKNIDNLSSLLDKALERNIFGTKMRSVIMEPNKEGIHEVVEQQFEFAKEIIAKGLVPIIEPEVDINATEKDKCEEILHKELEEQIEKLTDDQYIMLKLTIPSKEDLYLDLMSYSCVVRVLALSGGYSRDHANELLGKNHNMIASFSRALSQGLNVEQNETEFNTIIGNSIESIYEASVK